MTTITAPTPQPTPMSRPARRRLIWVTLAFALGAISGAGVTVAVDDDPSNRADVGTFVAEPVQDPATGGTGTPSGSPDAIERAAQNRQQTQTANCTRQPTSADVAERCVTAAG